MICGGVLGAGKTFIPKTLNALDFDVDEVPSELYARHSTNRKIDVYHMMCGGLTKIPTRRCRRAGRHSRRQNGGRRREWSSVEKFPFPKDFSFKTRATATRRAVFDKCCNVNLFRFSFFFASARGSEISIPPIVERKNAPAILDERAARFQYQRHIAPFFE